MTEASFDNAKDWKSQLCFIIMMVDSHDSASMVTYSFHSVPIGAMDA